MQLAWGYAPPLIMEAAVRHRVFDFLNEGPKTVAEVSGASGASLRGLSAIMNALVGLELLSKDSGDRYSLTPESAAFLVSGKPGYQGGFLCHLSGQMIPRWLELTEIVRVGQPPKAVNREGEGSEFFQQFVEDLFPMGYPAARVLADALGIAGAKQPVRVLDLAAGSGVWSIGLAQASPLVTVTAVDWAGVLPVTRKMAARFGLADRFRFIEGDLASVDFGRDHTIATLGHILHSEGEQRSRALLRKSYDALAPGGTIVIAEFLVNAERTGSPQGLFFAVNMLIATEEGNTFSFEEIGSWLREAGFENPRTLDAPAPSPLILAKKPDR